MSMHGGGPMGRFSTDPEKIKARNAEAPKIEHLVRRIAELFSPYKKPLALVILLILVSASLSVLPPLLIQGAFNQGLFPKNGKPDLGFLTTMVFTMIGIWLLAASLGVWQTYLTASVGNKVTGSLRVRMFAHLQSMELAFFTKTKTGAIQSRLSNDVGGVAGVLSNTISSILGSSVTVLASMTAMLLLSWQLTIVALIMLPLMVFLQRRVGQVRAKIASKTQDSLSEMSSITQESGRQRHLAFEELRTPGQRGSPIRSRKQEPDLPSGSSNHERASVLCNGSGFHVFDSSGYLPVCRLADSSRGRALDRNNCRLHHRPIETLVPDDESAPGEPGPANLAGSVRQNLRILRLQTPGDQPEEAKARQPQEARRNFLRKRHL